ncbi:MAG: ADP-ribosylglycohydrolase family protein [Spirochaetes bacterium]|jgi:ADP-ribosylglycohydrolase|nr:ADP-ribosylglycohydrolase family protein [Spirochaetota bacterium]
MIGAITGDIVGSIYEHRPIKRTDFPLFDRSCRFTDDTVLTVAVADAILCGAPYAEKLREWHALYPHAGYGGSFRRWASTPGAGPYNSWGNGSAMRVSPVGYAFDTIGCVLDQAARSAEVTHNHPEGIKGASAVAAAIFMARTGSSKHDIGGFVESEFGYDMSRTIDGIRPSYRFDVSCQGSVPEALMAFMESVDFEDAVRKAVSLGGDSDTIACIAGAVAEAFYGGVPGSIRARALAHLDDRLRGVVGRFVERYGAA